MRVLVTVKRGAPCISASSGTPDLIDAAVRQWSRSELHSVDPGMGQTHRDLNRAIGSHDGYMRGSRLAHREVVDRLGYAVGPRHQTPNRSGFHFRQIGGIMGAWQSRRIKREDRRAQWVGGGARNRARVTTSGRRSGISPWSTVNQEPY